MGIMTGFSVKAAIASEYSATVNFAGTTDAALRWKPISAHLQTSAGDLEMSGATHIDAFGSVRHVFGVVTAVSNDKGVADVQSSCNIHSFAVRLNKFSIIDAYDTPTGIQDILTTFMADNATAPPEIYDFSGMEASYVFQGLIRGDNILEEMAKLAQAAGADLFVNERGVLVCETWKTQSSPIDMVIPDSFLIAVSREENIDDQVSEVVVRGRYIGNEGLQSISNTINEINGNGEGGCFLAGTKVLLAGGLEKNIEDIKVGNKVQSFNFAGKFRESRVSDIFSTRATTTLSISTDRARIEVTERHPFYSETGQFVLAKNLRAGDTIYSYNETGFVPEKIIGVVLSEREVDVYNITADEHATYFANGFAVHNKDAPHNKSGGVVVSRLTGHAEESVVLFNEVVDMGGNANAAAQFTPQYAEYGSPLTRKQKTDGVKRFAQSKRSYGQLEYGIVKEEATVIFALRGDEHRIEILATAASGQDYNGRRVGIKITDEGAPGVSVTGQTITVEVDIGTTTGDDIISLVNGDAAASKLVTLAGNPPSPHTDEPIQAATGIIRLSDFGTQKKADGEVKAGFEIFADIAGSASSGAGPDAHVLSQLKDIDNKLTRLRYLTYTPIHKGNVNNVHGGNLSSTDYPRSRSPDAGETIFGASNSVTDFASAPNETRVEQRVAWPSLVDEYGIVTAEIDNEYLDTASQCYLVGVRLLQEQIMNRNQFKVSMVYSPNVYLNSVVQFSFKDQAQYVSGADYSFAALSGEVVTGRVIELSINYDTTPSATMSLTVQSFTELSSSRFVSGNLIGMPGLQSIDGRTWKTKYTKAQFAKFTGSCVISGSTINATGIGDTGFIAGQWIRIAGAADSRNNTAFMIESLTSDVLTIRSHDTLYAETADLSVGNSCAVGDEFVKVRFVAGIGKFVDNAYVEQDVMTPAGAVYTLRCNYSYVGATGTLTISVVDAAAVVLATEQVTGGEDIIELSFEPTTTNTTIRFEVSAATDDTLITIREPTLVALTLP